MRLGTLNAGWISVPRAFLFATCFASLAFAQRPLISERAVTFTPRIIPFDSTSTVWRTEYGSYDKVFAHKRILEMKIRVTGEVEPAFGCAWFFFGRETDSDGEIVIYGKGDRLARLGPGNTVTLLIESPAIGGSDTKYAALQQRDQSGVKPWAWAFAMFQGGRVVAVTASTPECADLGRTHARDFLAEKQKAPSGKKPAGR